MLENNLLVFSSLVVSNRRFNRSERPLLKIKKEQNFIHLNIIILFSKQSSLKLLDFIDCVFSKKIVTDFQYIVKKALHLGECVFKISQQIVSFGACDKRWILFESLASETNMCK